MNKRQVEAKSPRLLIFPKQQGQINKRTAMNYFTEMKKEHQQLKVLPTEFYISLLSLEPKQAHLVNPTIELIRTLIDSYLIIIEQLQGQDGLMIYFKDKVNSLLEQPLVKQCIEESDDQQLQQMLQKSQQSYQKLTNAEEIEVLKAMNPPKNRNSLATYITMHDRLEKEYDKAQQILQDFDDHVAQFDELMQKDLDNQKNTLEDRLKKRSITLTIQVISQKDIQDTYNDLSQINFDFYFVYNLQWNLESLLNTWKKTKLIKLKLIPQRNFLLQLKNSSNSMNIKENSLHSQWVKRNLIQIKLLKNQVLNQEINLT